MANKRPTLGQPANTQPNQNPKVIYATAFSLESDKLAHEVKGTPKHSHLWRENNNLCLIADECDSVLFDNAGGRIRSSMTMPFAEDIKAVAEKIAKLAYNFKLSGEPLENSRQIFINMHKDSLSEETKHDVVLKEYISKHIESWLGGL